MANWKRYLPITVVVVVAGVFWKQALVILASAFVILAAMGVMLGFRDWIKATLSIFAGMLLLFVGVEAAIWLGRVVLEGEPPVIRGVNVLEPWHIMVAGLAMAYVAKVASGIGRSLAGAGAIAFVLLPLPGFFQSDPALATVALVVSVVVVWLLFGDKGALSGTP